MQEKLQALTGMATIVAAMISAWALIKVNRIDNQDRIRRSLWVVEEYMIILGKCIENPSKENMELYKSYYMLCNLYADEWLRMELQKIDNLIEKRDMSAVKERGLDLTIKYSKKYKMKLYTPKKKWINY